jgi:hypothetical protein
MAGRWRFDDMVVYLHVRTSISLNALACSVNAPTRWHLHFDPGQDLPLNAAALLASVPEEDTSIIDDID